MASPSRRAVRWGMGKWLTIGMAVFAIIVAWTLWALR
jgi:hypothetical protein